MKYLRLVAPFLFLGMLVVICFYKVVFFHEVLFGTFDNFSYVIPLKYFFVEEVKKGVFPLWNPYLLTGIPYVGDLTIGTFSIFNIFYFLFPIPFAVSVLAAVSVFLIGFFQYLYLRLLKISKVGSLFGAVTFAFAGNIFSSIGAVDFITTIVWIPLIFSTLFLFTKKKDVKYFLLLFILQALQLFSGHPRPTFYTIQFVVFFFLFWSDFSFKKKFFLCNSYGIGIFLLTSVQLLPFIENALLSSRPLSSIAFASSNSLSLPYIITAFLPEFFGSHKVGTWWGPQVELFGYLGIPGLLFLLIGILKGKIVQKFFYVVSLILSFLLALGKISPIYILFYYLIPGWKQFRAPIDVMVLFTFFASVLIASGFDIGIKKSEKIRKVFNRILPLLFCLCILLAGIVVWTKQRNFLGNFLYTLYNKLHFHLLSRILIYDNTKLQVMFGGILFQIFLLILFCLITCFLFYLFSKAKCMLGVTLIIFNSCVFIYFDSFVVMTTPNIYPTVANPSSRLVDVKNGDYRVLSLPIDLHQQKTNLAIPDFFFKESLVKFAILESGNNIQQGIYQANGFATLIPTNYESFIGHNNANIISIDFSHVTSNQLNLSSIKYIISHDPLPFSSTTEVLSTKGTGYYVYENPFAYKRAYLVNNPLNGNVQIVKDTTQRIEITAFSSKPTHLIVSDLYYPGWIATVNGKNTTIQPYKNTFQMIALPQGNSTIILSYQPKSFIIGLWLSLSAFFIWIVLFLFIRKKTL